MTRRAGKASSAPGNKPGTDDHLTPPEVVERLEYVRMIALDPCGHEKSPATQAARISNGSRKNGLDFSWLSYAIPGDLIYVNPPFSDIDPWVNKGLEAARLDRTVVYLVPCRTSQPYWSKLCNNAAAIAFWKGNADRMPNKRVAGYLPRRMRFLDGNGKRQAGAPCDVALFCLSNNREHVKRFLLAFCDVASVVFTGKEPSLSVRPAPGHPASQCADSDPVRQGGT